MRAALTLARSAVHNLHQLATRRVRADVCIFGDGVGDLWMQGRWFNRLVDHFVAVEPERTLVVADQFEWRWPFPRACGRWLLHAPLQARLSVQGRLARSARRSQASELVAHVVQHAHHHLQWRPGAEREHRLVEMLAAKWAMLPQQLAAYERLLRAVRPRVLLVGAACYGPAAALIAAARRLGIVTAEYQHGAISAGHDGYNFAPAVLADAGYRETLPHHFLAYGRWWAEQINAPVAKVAVGHPHRSEQLARIAAMATKPTARKDLLILSDGVEFGLYLRLAQHLRGTAREAGLHLRLRPHPLERARVASLAAGELTGISIDLEPDLYTSLRQALVLVSEVSTGLFEAVGLVPRILLWDTPKARFGYPVHPFQTFTDADSLAALLRGKEAPPPRPLDAESIWAGGWRDNYRSFLAACGVA
ncbi:MAG: hypothetical protein HZC37_20345 [Burkholderiales bacterium]|nr:hypothetical protein [Burkholderiales bacterium]